MGNRSDWRRAMPQRQTIMQRFQEAGYRVKGAGKIFITNLEECIRIRTRERGKTAI